MFPPIQTRNTVAATLFAPELHLLESYAQDHQITLGEAALEAFRLQLKARYVVKKPVKNAVRFTQ